MAGSPQSRESNSNPSERPSGQVPEPDQVARSAGTQLVSHGPTSSRRRQITAARLIIPDTHCVLSRRGSISSASITPASSAARSASISTSATTQNHSLTPAPITALTPTLIQHTFSSGIKSPSLPSTASAEKCTFPHKVLFTSPELKCHPASTTHYQNQPQQHAQESFNTKEYQKYKQEANPKKRRFHLNFLHYLHHLSQTLAPLVSITTGEPHPAFPRSILHYHLLTSDQLDDLSRYYHQVWPPVPETFGYPIRIPAWVSMEPEPESKLEYFGIEEGTITATTTRPQKRRKCCGLRKAGATRTTPNISINTSNGRLPPEVVHLLQLALGINANAPTMADTATIAPPTREDRVSIDISDGSHSVGDVDDLMRIDDVDGDYTVNVVTLETKRRRFGRFVGMRGCQSPVGSDDYKNRYSPKYNNNNSKQNNNNNDDYNGHQAYIEARQLEDEMERQWQEALRKAKTDEDENAILMRKAGGC